jgi:hypothetical protein
MRLLLLVAFLGLGLVGSTLWISTGKDSRDLSRTELFHQNQDCQPELGALKVRFPGRQIANRGAEDSEPESQARLVTNCRRFGFQYLLTTLELTDRAYWLSPGEFYTTNGNMERDLIVHVGHLQPATSIMDPTISTNLYLLAFADRLQHARANFNGTRQHLGGDDFDRFSPYLTQSSYGFWFLSRQEARPEFVGWCSTPPKLRSICRTLVYSQQDGFAFDLTTPGGELDRLGHIVERSLALIRKWLVQS